VHLPALLPGTWRLCNLNLDRPPGLAQRLRRRCHEGGVLVRETLDADSNEAFLFVVKGGRIRFATREEQEAGGYNYAEQGIRGRGGEVLLRKFGGKVAGFARATSRGE